MLPESAVYLQQLTWLLDQFVLNLRQMPLDALVAAPRTAELEGNNPLAIVKHALAETRVYALGFGCGVAVTRNRPAEFIAVAAELDRIIEDAVTLRAELAQAFERLTTGQLDELFLPDPSPYGEGDPRTMTPREAIVEAIRHGGIHLGESRLTRALG